MTDRPLYRSTIDQLETLFGKVQDIESLNQLKNELQFRNTPRATNLLRKVDAAIKAAVTKAEPPSRLPEAKNSPMDTAAFPDTNPAHAVPLTKNLQFVSTDTTMQHKKDAGSKIQVPAPNHPIAGQQNDRELIEAEAKQKSFQKPAPDNHSRLSDLLEYLEHLAKLGEKPVFNLKEYQQLVFSESDLKGQIGITHDVSTDGEPVWLRIERLQRTNPPQPPEAIRDWIVISRDPYQSPKILDVLTITVAGPEADELVSSEKARAEDRSPSLKLRDGKQMFDVTLRLDDQPSTKSSVTNYISAKWAPWAEAEKPRRATIAIYDKFFSLYQSLQAEGVERPLEIVWGIGVARWRVRSQEIDHPLIEQLVEIDVDTESGVITIGPRSAAPQPALKPYFSLEIDGVDATLSFVKHFFETMPVDLEFSPFQRSTFDPVLRFAATQLDSSGRYHPDGLEDINDRSLPPITGSLVVTDTWAIYARTRSANFFIEDLDRLRKAVTSTADLPGPCKKLVEPPSSENAYFPTLIDVTKATLGGPPSGFVSAMSPEPSNESERDFFFPKAFNADQVAIVQRLEEADGVVVQGPPGTGKTHTIANIICHYLATGRKVLVTSRGEAALGVLREHIPEGIRDLTISLLTSEREGLKQLERAVGLLASAATQMSPSNLERQILAGQQQLVDLKRRLVSIDAELATFAKKHLGRIPHKTNADGVLPIELAQILAIDADLHTWLPDSLNLDSKNDPLFNEEDIAALNQARRSLGKDICYAKATVPMLADLLEGGAIVTLHEDLANSAQIEHQIHNAYFPRLHLTTPDAAERCKALSLSIKQMLGLFDIVDELGWIKPFVKTWQEGGPETDRDKLFEAILVTVGEIRKKRTDMIADAISCPDATIGDTVVVDAVRRAAIGDRPFGLIPFGKAQARDHFSLIRIEGRTPSSTEDWYKVDRYLAWRSKLSSTIARWNAMAPEYSLPHVKDQGDITARRISDVLDKIDKAKVAIRQDAVKIKRELPELFPHGLDPELVTRDRDHAVKAIEAMDANLSVIRYGASRTILEGQIQKLNGASGPIVEKLRSFLMTDVGNPEIPAKQISESWQEICREIDRVNNLKPCLETVNRVARLIRESGAPRWAEFVLEEAVEFPDKWTPNHWSESWSWVRFRTYLREIDGRDRFRHLSILRRKYEVEIQQAFSEVVRLRTYLGLKRNITNQVEAALNMFIAALRHIGKGTGIRARRFRQDARNAMDKSYAAVPCWIMPTWRVSESLPASLGSFDLVIIDEASQSDITALPALLRGKKVLVVGDDKQVSPTAAFVEEKKLLQLKHNYLKDQPFGPLMLPGFSLYELALAAFPGKRIMLREHFRCVEPIIRFSFQFYEEPIIPVRIAKPSERLAPPLVDVYVPHGRKDKRQINTAEAEAIVDEIEKIVKDPMFEKRSIGVVSLLAAKQAYYIQTRLLERIGEEEYLKHQITCGDSATFQGKERDIMFVSMVECPETRSMKTALLFQQRFNVALSRARDRMYLFRSVTEDMLKPDDLKARVLQHFKRPMPVTNEFAKAPLEQCDSDFERDVLKRLLGLGYRVTPQVKVGPFSIDMVVEGDADRRLAIELDGDKYHTPDRWADDLSRQRVMERVGWRFWRCWGSSFLLDPESCFADLIGTLNELQIRPSALDPGPSSYTEFRVIQDLSKIDPRAISTADEEQVVEVGDQVLVMFNDEPGRQHTIVVSADKTDEIMGIYSANHSLGKAMLGAIVEDQISFVLAEKVRTATILGIEKPSRSASLRIPNDRGTQGN
jgi:very-short-patch-repair endonuclease